MANSTFLDLPIVVTPDGTETLAVVVPPSSTTGVSKRMTAAQIASLAARITTGQLSGLSVLGNGSTTLGLPLAITGAAGQVARINDAGTGLAFGQINLNNSASVTGSLGTSVLPVLSGLSVLGNSSTVTQAISAISGTTDQTLVVNHGGTGLLFGQVNLGTTAAVTGTLAVSQGGIGTASLIANGILIGNGTAALASIANGTAGFVLTSNGTGSAATFQAAGQLALAGLSVFGVTGTSVANATAIVGAASQVLRVNSGGTGLAFGPVNVSSTSAITGGGGTALDNISAFSTTGYVYRSGTGSYSLLPTAYKNVTVISGQTKYTATIADQGNLLFVDTNGPPQVGSCTIVLPELSTLTTGTPFLVKKAWGDDHPGKVIVNTQGSDLADNSTSWAFEIPGEFWGFAPSLAGTASYAITQSLWSIRGSSVKSHHSIAVGWSVGTPYNVDGTTANGEMFDLNTGVSGANAPVRVNLPPVANLVAGYNPGVLFTKKDDDSTNAAFFYSQSGQTIDQAQCDTYPMQLQGFGDVRAFYTDGAEFRTFWEFDAHQSYINQLSLSSTNAVRQGNACAASATIYLVANNGDHIAIPLSTSTTNYRWAVVRARSTISHLLSASTYGYAASANAVHNAYAFIAADGSIQLLLGAANAGSSEYTPIDGVNVNASGIPGSVAAFSARLVGVITTNGSSQVVYVADNLISPSQMEGYVGINTTPPTSGGSTLDVRPALSDTFVTLNMQGSGLPQAQLTVNASGTTLKTATNDPILVGTNNTTRVVVAADGGVYSAGATGSSKGANSLNFSALYASQTATIGVAGTTRGQLVLGGNTTGVVTIQPATSAGNWTLTLPSTTGSASQFLQTDGTGTATWASARMLMFGSSGGSNIGNGGSIASPMYVGGYTGAAVEYNVAWTVPFDCTFKNLWVNTTNNAGVGNTFTCTIRAGAFNGVMSDTSLQCVISGGSSKQGSDTTHTASLTAGQVVVLKVEANSSANVAYVSWGCEINVP